MDLARISGMKMEELKDFLRLRGLRTYEEVALSPQNSFQSAERAVQRSGVLGQLVKEENGAERFGFNNKWCNGCWRKVASLLNLTYNQPNILIFTEIYS